MKLEISYGSGTRHELELAAEVAVLGRDPHCDVVLNDSKCSRRHAIIENGPGGLIVKDAGSANGISVNGRRVQNAPLSPGDTLQLGDVSIRVLTEVGETMVVAPDDLALEGAMPAPLEPARATPPPPPPPPPPPRAVERSSPRPRTARPGQRRKSQAERPQPGGRPPTVTLLAVLWALGAPATATALLIVAHRLGAGPLGWVAAVAGSGAAVGLGAAMVFGLLTLAPWARHLQLAAAAAGLLLCPATPAAATVLLYLTRSDVRDCFERRAGAARSAGEPAFVLTLIATLVLGAAASAALVLFFEGGGRP